eukprot:5816399-Amphidinium_carterae.3
MADCITYSSPLSCADAKHRNTANIMDKVAWRSRTYQRLLTRLIGSQMSGYCLDWEGVGSSHVVYPTQGTRQGCKLGPCLYTRFMWKTYWSHLLCRGIWGYPEQKGSEEQMWYTTNNFSSSQPSLWKGGPNPLREHVNRHCFGVPGQHILQLRYCNILTANL